MPLAAQIINIDDDTAEDLISNQVAAEDVLESQAVEHDSKKASQQQTP